jgi:hypothetical protein
MKKLSFLLFTFLFLACGVYNNGTVLAPQTPLGANDVIDILGAAQKVPNEAKIIGTFHFGETGLTGAWNCTYEKLVQKAMEQARTLGANIVFIEKHRNPNILSNCHAIQGTYYRNEPIKQQK